MKKIHIIAPASIALLLPMLIVGLCFIRFVPDVERQILAICFVIGTVGIYMSVFFCVRSFRNWQGPLKRGLTVLGMILLIGLQIVSMFGAMLTFLPFLETEVFEQTLECGEMGTFHIYRHEGFLTATRHGYTITRRRGWLPIESIYEKGPLTPGDDGPRDCSDIASLRR